MNQNSKQMLQKEIDYAARAERTDAVEKVKDNHNE